MDHSRIKKESIIEQAVLKQLNNDDYEGFKIHLLNCDECRNELLRTKLLFSAADLSRKDAENAKLTIPFFLALLTAVFKYPQKHIVAISIVALVIVSAVVLELQYHFISSPDRHETYVANADAFTPNNYLESIINTNLRSGSELSISSPEPDFQFRYNEKNGVPFTLAANMPNAKNKDIEAKILSNNEIEYLNDSSLYIQTVTITPEAGKTVLSLQEQLFLNRGLYYFVLQYKNEIDYIYVARFYVK